ncbi:MAG: hypothetical protein ILP02_00535 [Clostridia bacterium]|nr:hypothetical protein [Clostridia bacterium]
MQAEKDVKTLAREAKQRLKSGFWEKYKDDVKNSSQKARSEGVAESVVISYYQQKNAPVVKKAVSESDGFYLKVKRILDEKGKVGNIIALLIDHSVFDGMNYDSRQKYILELSNKYLAALDRYNAEKKFL